METGSSQDPLMRERARRRRARQVQRRRVVLVVGVLLLILIVVLVVVLSGGGKSTATTITTAGTGGSTSTTASATAETFTADLTGAAEVPAVSTAATGSVTLDYDPAADTLSFTLNISQLTNPSTARIYQGKAGATGTAVLTLFSGTKSGVFSGELNQGSVKDSDLTGSLRGKTIADLIALISASNAYVSVGTTSHPNGAIRGQLK